jgi:hypothetical protein
MFIPPVRVKTLAKRVSGAQFRSTRDSHPGIANIMTSRIQKRVKSVSIYDRFSSHTHLNGGHRLLNGW